MNTVDTALKQYVVKTPLGTRIDIPAPLLEKYIESLTNEAELRGRTEEVRDSINTMTQTDWGRSAMIQHQQKRLAALLKLKGGEEKQHD